MPVDIALCICPHLREFLVVDQRRQLPGRPTVQVLSADAVLDEEFYREMEQEFSHALRQEEWPFATLMALSQIVEGSVRQHSLEAILRAANDGAGQEGDTPSVAVLLFTGDTLAMDEEEMAHTLEELLGSDADEATVATAQRHLTRLIAQEQQFERQVHKDWLSRVIRGNAGDFFTLWQQSQ